MNNFDTCILKKGNALKEEEALIGPVRDHENCGFIGALNWF